MLLTPGQILAERYRIIGLLGQGGMAAVYCAHDRALDRLAAVKQLRPDPMATEKALKQAREQFQREAQILATLDHPNLPRVTDYFERDGLEYLVMDYVEGQTLSDVVDKSGRGMDEERILDWADQLLSALEYIHRHGIIHRDIKPSNIRLTPDGRIFLVDFGLVKLFDPRNTKTATIMHGLGTPEYAPPEQYDSHQGHTDPRSDLYALGATLYHLFTGGAPPTATQRVSDPKSFRPPRALGVQISPDIERAIVHAMELQRTQRFTSATEMRAELGAARRLKPAANGLTQRLNGLTERLPGWNEPARRVLVRRAAPFAALVLVMVIGGALGLANQVGAEAPATSATVTPSPTLTQRPTTTPTASPRPSATRRRTSTIGAGNLSTAGTATPSFTPTSTRIVRRTATPSSTATATFTFTPAPRQPSTATFTPAPTITLRPTSTFTPRPPTNTPTETPRPIPTSDPTETDTPIPDTDTPVPPIDTLPVPPIDTLEIPSTP
ncbi:MAG TPA: protein kinase [Anaerolineae bacterium]|nr:protein kinase [Anaerolineae bacterium]